MLHRFSFCVWRQFSFFTRNKMTHQMNIWMFLQLTFTDWRCAAISSNTRVKRNAQWSLCEFLSFCRFLIYRIADSIWFVTDIAIFFGAVFKRTEITTLIFTCTFWKHFMNMLVDIHEWSSDIWLCAVLFLYVLGREVIGCTSTLILYTDLAFWCANGLEGHAVVNLTSDRSTTADDTLNLGESRTNCTTTSCKR